MLIKSNKEILLQIRLETVERETENKRFDREKLKKDKYLPKKDSKLLMI